MKLLFLSQRVPYPPNRGDKITTWQLVDRFRKAHDVTVIAFAHDEADVRAARELRGMGVDTVPIPLNLKARKLLALPLLATSKPLTLGVFGSKQLKAEVDARIAGADFAYAYSSSMGAFLAQHDTPWIMHFAELDSDKWRQYAERTSWPMSWIYKREAKQLLAFETHIAGRTATNVFCTPLEEKIFQEHVPGKPSLVVRNGVDLEYFSPAGNAPEHGHLVFTGVMDYLPNIDGCQWFVDEILPRIRESVPETTFTIVGSRPTSEVDKLAETAGVSVTGFVDDTRDYLRRAAVSVAPLRIARGIQNKVLEALAMGLPVVGTTSATQGVEGEPERDYLVRDEAEAFADEVVRLLQDRVAADTLARAGRALVEERYAWSAVLAPLDAYLPS
ncbi:MAG: TIGR03087 family PEP-CTERM/XrtA system glycosyltransferase [Planctomycetota bacterium]|nr:TIGR03087 family PEP-CTERM/XrtA system glycosyltransferase [Planctomycetota bacterium]